ncbi:MAG: YtxH domain-containing protein [Gemmatimonadaceae bacterium]
MSYARPARPGGTAGRDPAGESTTPADVARGDAATAGRSTRTSGSTAAGSTTTAGDRAGTGRFSPSARAAALRAADMPRGAAAREQGEELDWRRVSTLGLGLAIGALIGAGAALLLAPQSGEETRELITRGARRLRSRAEDGWSDLGAELRTAARRRRKQLRRGVTRGRWAVADLMDE